MGMSPFQRQSAVYASESSGFASNSVAARRIEIKLLMVRKALNLVKRRWLIVGVVGLLILSGALAGARRSTSDPVMSNLPFQVDRISNSYLQMGNQIKQYQSWRLREAKDAVAEFKQRCTKQE